MKSSRFRIRYVVTTLTYGALCGTVEESLSKLLNDVGALDQKELEVRPTPLPWGLHQFALC